MLPLLLHIQAKHGYYSNGWLTLESLAAIVRGRKRLRRP
jgi:hypothetical protein